MATARVRCAQACATRPTASRWPSRRGAGAARGRHRCPHPAARGVFDAAELAEARQRLWMVVHHEEQLRMLERTPLAAPMDVLKVNSGMNRARFRRRRGGAGLAAPAGERQQVGRIVLMTHFARADEPDMETTLEQLQRFEAATAGPPGARSVANSAAILAGRRHAATGRAQSCSTAPIRCRPRQRPACGDDAGERGDGGARDRARRTVGYGGRFVAERPTRVGLVAMGLRRRLPARGARRHPVAVEVARAGSSAGVDGHADDRLTERPRPASAAGWSCGALRCRSTASPRPPARSPTSCAT